MQRKVKQKDLDVARTLNSGLEVVHRRSVLVLAYILPREPGAVPRTLGVFLVSLSKSGLREQSLEPFDMCVLEVWHLLI